MDGIGYKLGLQSYSSDTIHPFISLSPLQFHNTLGNAINDLGIMHTSVLQKETGDTQGRRIGSWWRLRVDWQVEEDWTEETGRWDACSGWRWTLWRVASSAGDYRNGRVHHGWTGRLCIVGGMERHALGAEYWSPFTYISESVLTRFFSCGRDLAWKLLSWTKSHRTWKEADADSTVACSRALEITCLGDTWDETFVEASGLERRGGYE